MQEVTSNFAKQLMPSGSGGLGTVDTSKAEDWRWDLFTPTNKVRREFGVQDSLLNEKNFASYWAHRNKTRPDNHPPIQYAKATTDINDDGVEDLIAYFNDPEDKKNYILGYNNIYMTDPDGSQLKYKKDYYMKTAEQRKNQSYSDYLRTAAHVEGWMTDEDFKEMQKNKNKTLVQSVITKFNAKSTIFAGLKPSQKIAVANTFIKIVSDSMIADDANGYEVAEIKKLPKFVKAKKDLLKSVLGDDTFMALADTIVKNIVSGNGGKVEKACEKVAQHFNVFLSAEDVKTVFTAAQQKKYLHTLKPKVYDSNTHDAGYQTYSRKFYGGQDSAGGALDTFYDE